MLKWLEKIVTVEAHRVVHGTVSEFFFLLLVDRESDPVFGKMVVLTDTVVLCGLYGSYRKEEQMLEI